jgi:two-component system sensor histidine kinase UhpB
MSLRLRVVAAIALVLLISAAVGAGLAGWRARGSLHEEFAAALTGGRLTVLSAYEDLPRSDHQPRDLRQLIATFDGNRHVMAQLIDGQGRVVAASRRAPAAPSPAWFSALLRTDLPPQRLATPVESDVVVLTPVWASDVGATWIAFIDLAAVLAGAFAVSALLVWLTVGRALRPLAAYSAAFQRIGSGDYGAKVSTAGPRELARLGQGVNEMAQRLAAVQARNHALEHQLLTLQDEERADLARDLHDEIGPHLFAVNVDAAMIGRLAPAEAVQTQVKAIQASVGHMQRLVRDILSRLRPAQLFELGLAAAIGDLVAFWRTRHGDIAFDVRLPDDDAPMSEAALEAVYRVVQEGLNNAVRHGRPSRIEIVVVLGDGGEVTARVSDNGAATGDPGEGGFGLIGMRERVAAAHGSLTVERGGGAGGWSVTARLPTGADLGGGTA